MHNKTMLYSYVINILYALDCLLNAVMAGDPREPVSSRAGKKVDTCLTCKILCAFLNFVDKDHCKKYIVPNVGDRAVIEGTKESH